MFCRSPGLLRGRTDLLHLVASEENLAILSALATGPEYPRRLGARLHRGETHVARRLRMLERAGIVRGSWSREDGKNVRLYRLRTRSLTVVFDPVGYRVQSPTRAVDRELSGLERVPPRRSVFGREEESAVLASRESRFSMVVGLPGMGKTSLATEAAYRHGVNRVVWHTFTPFDSAWRLLALASQWLAMFHPARGWPPSEENSDIAELLDRVTDGLSRRRLLIVLDDYHKVRDEGVHEIVRRWKRSFVNAKVIILSRTRPPFDMDSTTQLVMLHGLDRAASRNLLRENGLNVTSEELDQVERAFGGHPLSLRLYAQQPGTTPGRARPAMEGMGREAFEALDGKSQQVLLAMATVRRPLDPETVRFLTGQQDPSLPLATLERRALIRSEAGRYLIHDVLREALSLIVASHQEMHRRATALFLPSESADDLVEALYHATKAGDWSVASNLLERDLVGQRDMPSGSVHSTVLVDVLDGIPVEKLDARHRAMFHRSHALALLGIARNSAVIRELDTARRLAEPLGDPHLLSWVLSPLGLLMAQTGHMAAAERLLMQNLRLVEAEGRSADKADALFVLALFWDRKGSRERAKRFWRLALKEARRVGNKRLIAEFSTWHVGFPSNWRDMIPRLRKWRADFRRWGMPRQVAGMDCLAGEILSRMERYRAIPRGRDVREAVGLLRRSVTAFEAIGDRYEATYARSWLALALFLAKENDEAEAMANAVITDDRRLGEGYSAILGHQVLSRLCRSRGDMDAARKHLDISIRVARRMQCASVGIALLERAVHEAESNGEIASRISLRRGIEETIQKGYPDEVRYARWLARQHLHRLPHEHGTVAIQFGRPTTAQGQRPPKAPQHG